jgi:3D-(3,5/4)-trihydroxycyclohexane-1,2-dione acylhydrolase (decyclizing)
MSRETIRLTAADAIVEYLLAQRTVVNGVEVALFPGVFAIFGHGNVTCLGHSLERRRDRITTWRGQNEQGMALAAIAYAKAMRRQQIMIATSSIGPGATNMVTAAGVAMANRLPLLLLAGDTFQSRLPDPVLQQVEHEGAPGTTVNDAFRSVVRYWDRITTPAQVISALPNAVYTMLDPATCGPAFIGLPQDIQALAYDFPTSLFEPTIHTLARPRAARSQLHDAAGLIRNAKRPLLIAGGGVHYSLAEGELDSFLRAHNIPVAETVAGKSSVLHDHPNYVGPVGVTGCESANNMAGDADLVIAVGTRLQDFTTGSWTGFAHGARIVAINVNRFDATKHRSVAVVGDARETLNELHQLLGEHKAPVEWSSRVATEVAGYWNYLAEIGSATARTDSGLPSYAQVVAAVTAQARPNDFALAAAGGFPGEVNNGWLSRNLTSFDCEYGFSCMGYEISGGWGAAMAQRATGRDCDGDVYVFVGDGSYLMMNSDIYSSVLSGHKLTIILCDNGGFAVINRLQVNQGGVSFNNLIADSHVVKPFSVDFAAHAEAMGASSLRVRTLDEFNVALATARTNKHTTLISIDTDPHTWTGGGMFWEVGVPEVSDRVHVLEAHAEMQKGKQAQWLDR